MCFCVQRGWGWGTQLVVDLLIGGFAAAARSVTRSGHGLSLPGAGGGGGAGSLGSSAPNQKNQKQMKIYQGGPKLEVEFRYTNFLLASEPPLPLSIGHSRR